MIRRALIISGNIIDLAFNRFNALTPINRVMKVVLKTQGFNQVIFYSRLNGISGISSDEWTQLTQVGMEVEQGEEYNFDDDDTQTNTKSNSGRIPIDPQNFFAVAERVMTSTQNKVAFIIDWSNYLFGQVNALSETEGHGYSKFQLVYETLSNLVTSKYDASSKYINFYVLALVSYHPQSI